MSAPKGSITFLRVAPVNAYYLPRTGVEYLHHFGTGHQELVFRDHAAAKRYAQSENLAYTGPAA